jgi:hypothetical protein
LLTSALALTGCTHLVGNGEKVGSVIKVSQEGVLNTTNEVEIVRGGMNGGSGSFSTTPLNGTVTDDAVYAQLKDALNGQYEVKVQYRDYFWTPISSDSGSRYIVAVQKMAIPVQAAKTPVAVTSAPVASTGSTVITNPVIEVQNGTILIHQK